MDKSISSNLKHSTAINLIIVIMLAIFIPSVFSNKYGEDMIGLNNKIISSIKNNEKILLPEEQILLVKRFNTYIKRETRQRALEKQMVWALMAGIGLSLTLQIIVLFKTRQNQSKTKKPLPGDTVILMSAFGTKQTLVKSKCQPRSDQHVRNQYLQ